MSGNDTPGATALGLRAPLLAGLWISGVSLALGLSKTWGLFLTVDERWRYVFAVVSGAVAASVLLWSATQLVVRLAREKAAGVAGAVACFLSAAIGWSLTEGRRVREASWREFAVVGGAVVIAWSSAKLLRRLQGSPHRLFGVVGFVAAALAILADALILPRLYPAFHWALALFALVLSNLAASAVFRDRVPARTARAIVSGVALMVAASAFVFVPRLGQHPNARFVVAEGGPWLGKWMPLFETRAPQLAAAEVEATPLLEAGIDLRDQDILLITIDALRADRLGAYGGSGTTPFLDEFAEESVVFRRAYTPTPHTSYALSSMLTGKFLRPVLELPNAPAQHPALPELLRQYGYRTAAFYPPAIFFVDAHRFREIAARDFGFEYRKVMFAPAAARARQLETYLGEVDAAHPVFAWVHLFEPHEPYEPPPEFARGDSRSERYDGEVAAADDAVRQLVAAFRARRPNATVIVTADHGEELGDHGGWYHGTTLYDEQVRVPLLWSSPGASVARAVDAPVEIIDVATTLLAAVGIPRDARMRGDDLGPLLRGASAAPPYGFAEIGEERMVVSDREKLICGPLGCRLFDLEDDPGETRNLAGENAARVEEMRGALGAFMASVPRIEAMAMGDAGWPEALARAELGDRSVAADLLPLLGDARAEVRAATARSLGTLEVAPALPTLQRLQQGDESLEVREECAIAALSLGDTESKDAVADALNESARGRRAALVLGQSGDERAAAILAHIVADPQGEESERVRALETLGALGKGEAELRQALADVRLRPHAVAALADIGTRSAANAIAEAMETERYLPAREVEAKALVRLRDRRAEPLIRRFLGMDTPVPSGVSLLHETGALGDGWDGARTAGLRCDEDGCSGEGTLSMEDETHQLVVLFRGTGTVVHSEEGVDVRGEAELILVSGATFRTTGDVRAVAAAVVPRQSEIPPPPPEPWDENASMSATTASAGAPR
ncbi:MAG: sulfatase-like hydrolase/transferase [Myxococcota bacterium]